VLIDMIALCWENGSVADDATTVAAAVGADARQVSRLWPILRSKFVTNPQHANRLFNRRLEVERAAQSAYRAEQSEKGKASAAARARKAAEERLNRGSTAVQPEHQPEGQPEVNSALCDVRSAFSVLLGGSEEPPKSSASGKPEQAPKGKAKKEAEPMPFTLTACCDALRETGGVIVDPFPAEARFAVHMTRIVRSYPRLDDWRRVGSWLAAGGDGYGPGWRGGKPDLGTLLRQMGAWRQQAMAWDGRPVVRAANGGGRVIGMAPMGGHTIPGDG
jgi:uncharacterized protein YdaU (DUF1376 family)